MSREFVNAAAIDSVAFNAKSVCRERSARLHDTGVSYSLYVSPTSVVVSLRLATYAPLVDMHVADVHL